MSIQAITAAFALQGLSPSEKLLLLALANYADEQGRSYPSQRRLAADTGLTDRTIRKLLADLSGRGLLDRLERTRSDGSRSSDIITLHLDAQISGGAEMVSGGVRNQLPGGAEVVSGLTTFEPPIIQLGTEVPKPMRKPEGKKPSVLDSAWAAYPTLGRERSWSKDKTLPIWRDAAKRAGGEPRLLAAVQRYVRLDKTHKGDAGPPGFHRWLKDGRWEHWLEGEVSAAVPLHTFAGADLRALLLKERGESWVRAWLDPADWEPDEQTILPRNGVAAAKLRQEVGPMLKRMGIHIRERVAA